jgi:8-oxo-dGTP diphosphatase
MKGIVVSVKPWALSVKVIIKDDEGRCLLLKRSLNSKGNPGRWEPPGGKINQNESFDSALMREVKEETGLTISIQHALGTSESELPKIKVVHLILEGQIESGKLHLSEEHDAYVWVNPTKLMSMDLVDWFKPFAKSDSQKIDQTKKPCEPSSSEVKISRTSEEGKSS